jgi:plastocyanin
MRRLIFAAAGLLVALTVAACSSASGAPIPSGPPASHDPDAVVIEARDMVFVQTEVEVPAGKPFTLVFDNTGDKYPHNVAIDDASGANVFRGDVIDGGKTIEYQVPALTAGSYGFKCDVHPNMTGTVVAK